MLGIGQACVDALPERLRERYTVNQRQGQSFGLELFSRHKRTVGAALARVKRPAFISELMADDRRYWVAK